MNITGKGHFTCLFPDLLGRGGRRAGGHAPALLARRGCLGGRLRGCLVAPGSRPGRLLGLGRRGGRRLRSYLDAGLR